MSSAHRRWTDADLERFVDEDLTPEDRAPLAEALRTDGALRARMSAIIEADARFRAGMLAEPERAGAARVGRRSMTLPRAACVAAALAIAATGVWWTIRPTAPPFGAEEGLSPQRADEFSAEQLLATARSDGVLIATVPNSALPELPVRPAAEPEPEAGPSEKLLAFLDAGELDGALAMMRDQPAGSDAEPLWRAFGERLYSGQAAQEALLSLSTEMQVEACRVWAEQPSLRPVTFEWLARLGASDDESVRESVAALREELSQRSELRAWLLSYAAAAR